jgi:ABC-type bacteriocin/lantibiotic exporter with double-glycine peptidase domain
VNKEFNNKSIPTAFEILKKIISYLDSKRKRQLIMVFFLSLLASLAESISIAMLVPFISFFVNPDLYLFNSLFEKIFKVFNINNNKEILGLVSFFFILAILISSYVKLKYIKISNKTTDNITSDFRLKIFNFLISQDFSYYFKHGSNEIMSNLTQKTGSFTAMIFASINILNSILISLAIIIILIFNEPFYTPIIIASIGLFFFIVFKIRVNTVLQKGQRVNLNQNFMVDIFENTVGYLPEIIIYDLKKFYSSILGKTSQATAQSISEIRTIGMTPRVYLEAFVIVFVVLFIYFSGFTERSIEANISYLAILAFGAQKCLPLINNIYNLSVSFKGSTPTVLTFLNILEGGKNKEIEDNIYKKLNFDKTIKLEKLSYQYDDNLPKILNNINLDINKGEKIAIKGETGSGKSTLINIISGLLSPTTGKILIDEVEIKNDNKRNWQKNISLVPQIVFLNDSSISENIAIAENLNEINFNKVKKCAELAQISEFIESLPNKYKEKVGERGVRLSGGQRQRIGIARALYREASLIIMDEPTNALDLATENLVMNSIMNLKNNITVIMISHSNNSLKHFDKVIDLDKLK